MHTVCFNPKLTLYTFGGMNLRKVSRIFVQLGITLLIPLFYYAHVHLLNLYDSEIYPSNPLERSIKDQVLGINFPYFAFNVTSVIESISKIQYESNNTQFTNYTSKFGIIRIRPTKIEYLIWKPILTSTLPRGDIEYEDKYPYQPYDRHTRMCLTYVRNYWHPTLLQLQNKLKSQSQLQLQYRHDQESTELEVHTPDHNHEHDVNNYTERSIILPLSFFSSAAEVWEPWLVPLSQTENQNNVNVGIQKHDQNSIFFSYCLPHAYLDNPKKYHSYLIPRYYTDPSTYFGYRGNGKFNSPYGILDEFQHDTKSGIINMFEKFTWNKRSNKAVFRGSLTNPWRYELLKIFKDNQHFYGNLKLKSPYTYNVTHKYVTKYNLGEYMDVSLTALGTSKHFKSLDEFNEFLQTKPTIHHVLPTKQLANEILHFIQDDVQKVGVSLTFAQQVQHFKYVIHIDGWSCAARLPKYLTAGFVVIWLRDDQHSPHYANIEDWYLDLQPYKHYVPVQWGNNNYNIKPRFNLTNEKDLKEIEEIVSTMPQRFERKIDALVRAIKYLQENDDIAKKIALNGQHFMRQHYTRNMVNQRVFNVLTHLPIRDAKEDGIDQFLQNSPLAKDWKLLTFLKE